jgi:hypothetical protein
MELHNWKARFYKLSGNIEREREKINTQTNIIKQKKRSEGYPWLATHKGTKFIEYNKRNAASFFLLFFFSRHSRNCSQVERKGTTGAGRQHPPHQRDPEWDVLLDLLIEQLSLSLDGLKTAAHQHTIRNCVKILCAGIKRFLDKNSYDQHDYCPLLLSTPFSQ